jgi:zinc protease
MPSRTGNRLPLALLLAASCAGARSTPETTMAPEKWAATPDDAFRASKPPPLQRTPKFETPVPSTRTLANGVQLLVWENHALPLVAVDVLVKTGRDGDPVKQPGLGSFTAQMLLEGTGRRSSLQIAEDRDDLAANLNTSYGLDSMGVHLNALKETLPAALDLLADVVVNPAFRQEDVVRVRGLILTMLEQKKGEPASLAGDQMARLLYGDQNPWGQPAGGTVPSVKSITREDLAGFHHRWVVPNNTVIAVSGDVGTEEIAGLIEKAFQSWKGRALPKHQAAPFPAIAKRTITLVDEARASQSQVWVGTRVPAATSPDALPLQVANNIVGGLFSSRLNLNLREDKAYSYGVRSSVVFVRGSGRFVAAGGIVAAHTAEALIEYEKELSRFGEGGTTDGEMERAKEAIIRSLPSALETNDAISSALARLIVLQRPLDYYRKLPDQVAQISKDDVARVARKYLQPDRWPAVVVGPRAMVEENLAKTNLGPVVVRPAE